MQKKVNDLKLHEDSASHDKVFSKDKVVITSRFLSIHLFWWETFVKAETNVKFRGNAHKFVELIPGVGQQQYGDIVSSNLATCTQKFSDTSIEKKKTKKTIKKHFCNPCQKIYGTYNRSKSSQNQRIRFQ